jgi:ring-1,2-phenylacetyl-CoA epoxidase subunit PaaC
METLAFGAGKKIRLMTEKEALYQYVLQIGDNALILGQRLGEWCGHGPVLEQDIAMTNIALDLMGQARSLMSYAAEVEGKSRTEDQVAFLRKEHEYRNVLLVEQPNEDFAYTIVRQFLFDSFHYYFQEALLESKDERLAAIAAKSLKEIRYHLKYSSEWMIRLGDGTEVSHEKIQTALDDLWMFSGELTQPNQIDQQMFQAGIGVDLNKIKTAVEEKVDEIIKIATLQKPSNDWMQSGGKEGRHTENMGFILSEMQYMQRAYPNMEW